MMSDVQSESRSEQENDGESTTQNSVSLPLPLHTELFSHQIGGHVHGRRKMGNHPMLGLLKHENGDILKPLRPDVVKDARELAFYERISNESCQDPIILELKNFMPTFKGTWIGHLNGSDIKYMCLGDVTDRFQKPCNMDVKIGGQTYDPEASEEKRRCENRKYPDGQILGFRIVGMKVFSDPTQKYFIVDRAFGKLQTPETIVDALHLYFNRGYQCFVWAALAAFLHKLKAIEDWFSVQRKYVFYSSSLLLIYEGDHRSWITWFQGIEHLLPYQQHSVILDCRTNCAAHVSLVPLQSSMCPSADHPNNLNKSVPSSFCQLNSNNAMISCPVCGLPKEICHEVTANCSLYDIRMIDFAHVFPSEVEDANYLFGLRNLSANLRSLLQKIVNARH